MSGSWLDRLGELLRPPPDLGPPSKLWRAWHDGERIDRAVFEQEHALLRSLEPEAYFDYFLRELSGRQPELEFLDRLLGRLGLRGAGFYSLQPHDGRVKSIGLTPEPPEKKRPKGLQFVFREDAFTVRFLARRLGPFDIVYEPKPDETSYIRFRDLPAAWALQAVRVTLDGQWQLEAGGISGLPRGETVRRRFQPADIAVRIWQFEF